MKTIHASLVITTLVMSGCANTYSDADYGRSVRQMVQSQTFDPAAASNPPELAPEITDGQRLKNALDVYRKDVAQGTHEVEQPILFEVATN
jgi:hypothetical protein